MTLGVGGLTFCLPGDRKGMFPCVSVVLTLHSRVNGVLIARRFLFHFFPR